MGSSTWVSGVTYLRRGIPNGARDTGQLKVHSDTVYQQNALPLPWR